MKTTLKGIREYKGWSLKEASEKYGININVLKEFEDYKQIPSSQTVSAILNVVNIDNENLFVSIFCDIISKYRQM